MRNFPDLDTSSFKAFYYSAETLNFTQAAKKAALTQSGVSQHIAKLEAQLGVPLFLRVKRSVILTEAGKKLRDYVERYLDDVDLLKEALNRETTGSQGLVSYAMPASCLMTPHFAILLESRRQKFPGVELKVTICPSEDVLARLLANEIDFGFVTKHTHDPDVVFSPFCQEEYVLIAGDKRELEDLSPKSLLQSRFLAYPGVDVLFAYWLAHHFPKARDITWDALNIVGEINSLHGVLEMVVSKMGMTIIPKHCVLDLLTARRVVEYRGKPLLNDIYIVTLADRALPRRAQALIDLFFEMKK